MDNNKKSIKPNLSFEQSVCLIKRLYEFEDVATLKEFVSYYNQNFLIEARRPGSKPGSPLERFVLKLTNSEDSREFELHKRMDEILLMVRDRGIQCCWPILNAFMQDVTLEKLSFKDKDTDEIVTGEFLVRILAYIPGQSLGDALLVTNKMCYEAGQLLGRLSHVLQDYSGDITPFVKRDKELIWSLNQFPRIQAYVHVVKDEYQKTMITEIQEAFEEKVVKEKHKLPKGLIHGDFSDNNIVSREQSCILNNGDLILRPGDEADVIGVLDFDHMMYSCIVYDIAIAIMYLMQNANLERDPLESGGIMLAGFLSKHALTEDGWGALYYCVAARFVQSLVFGLYTHSLQPKNSYILSTQKLGWQVLFDLWSQEVTDVIEQWRKLADQYNK